MPRFCSGPRLALLALCCGSALLAQRDLATLVGTVKDPSGAVVPKATVKITNSATNEVYTVTTNDAGEFVRPALRPSTYSVSVTAPGFQTAQQNNVVLLSGARTGVDITLVVGNVGQTVEVQSAAPLLQTESDRVGTDLPSMSVSEIPLGATRTFTFLARLSPGVLPGEPGSRDVAGGGMSANGVRSNGQNNFLLNGVDNNVNTIDILNQSSFAVGPSVEAISEMTVETNGYNAEYGRAAGAVVNINIKSGTNEVHGEVFEFLQNRDLDANTWTNDRGGIRKGTFEQNQFGGTLGGPIIKNKLFIFGDYQGTIIGSSGGLGGLGFAGITTIPTPAMTQGNFASLLGPDGKGVIYDPASTVGTGAAPTSRTPFAGNIIPPSRFDPATAKILQLFPAPNLPVAVGATPVNDYSYSTPGSAGTHQGDARVDYQLSSKSTLFGSLSWSDNSSVSTPPYPGALDDSGFTGASQYILNRNAQIGYTRVWSPTVVTESRAAFTRLVVARHVYDPGTDEYKAFGIGGYDPTNAYTDNGGLPQFTPSAGYSGFGGGTYTPSPEYNNVWDFVQNVAISKGSHAFKTGFEFRSIKFPFMQLPATHGQVTYSNNETAFPALTETPIGTIGSITGDPIASALLGQPDTSLMSTTNFMSPERVAYAGYVQDDWKVNSKLTVNLGMRYELWSPIGEQWGRQATFNLQTNTLTIPQGPNCNAALPPNFATQFPTVVVDRCDASKYMVRWDKFDFGPRIGIAYRFANKMVLRLGYGIFYGGEENQGGSPNRAEGVPFNETVTFSRANGISSFIGISDPLCTGCDFMPGGLTGGYPSNPFVYNAPIKLLGVQPDFDNPMVHKWNLIIQRELPGNMSAEVGYTGNHQAHQLILGDTDTFPNLGTTNSAITSTTLQEIGPACASPTCVSVGNGLTETVSNGFGNYNAVDGKVEKRFSQGLYFVSSFTWSHTLANSSTPLSGSTNFGFPNDTNWASGYSDAAWNIPLAFTTGFNYQLPFGKGKKWGAHFNRATDAVLGGWQTNGLLTLRSGVPYTINGSGCEGVWNRCEPNIVSGYTADQAPSSGRTANEWFNPNAYTVAAPLTGGDLGIQNMVGPPTKTLDFSMFKTFALTERFNLQFRAESFNITNHPVLNIPDANLSDSKALGGSGAFGEITSGIAGSERHLQFALKLLW
ncbi:MAG TPA: carboxypeptidase-like regulatory domain-containing protein [Bryobacteraceae bacterium]|nr:carboxypeptidase-like regulatory domain-containing protein [Bryobacteraceae bacterium]